jgi:hypothetical protein
LTEGKKGLSRQDRIDPRQKICRIPTHLSMLFLPSPWLIVHAGANKLCDTLDIWKKALIRHWESGGNRCQRPALYRDTALKE